MYFFLSLILSTLFFSVSYTQAIILDAETQNWLQDMFIPLAEAADISPQNVRVGVLLDRDLNAFATLDPHGGHRIFFHSELILKAGDEEEVRGVLAHELGHVHANHLFELRSNIARSKWLSIAGTVAGLGAAAAGGGTDAALAGILGGQAAATSNLLGYSRTQEREADQLAEQYLKKTDSTLDGLFRFMTKLRNENLLLFRTPPPFLLTHPLPNERLETMQNALGRAAKPATPTEDFLRIQAKIAAFSRTPAQVLRTYRENTQADRVARAIAFMEQSKLERAAAEIEILLQNAKDDPYIQELAGHLALEQQDFNTAIQHFTAALGRKESPLFRYHLARAYQAQGEITTAVEQAQRAAFGLPRWGGAYQLLGTLQGQNKQLGAGHLSLAEAALLRFRLNDAEQQLRLAEKYLTDDAKLRAKHTALQDTLARLQE